ncbi:MAG: metallophosphoesterase family protein [Clostridiales bacterium]|nr:metallophosphoesterase family protein [Clostridiales bacterium]
MKKRNRWIALMMAAAMAAVPGVSALADAAPDGKTVNDESTDSTYKEWKESDWEETEDDWTLVSMTPGEDESQMNFAWYSKDGEETSLVWGTQEDLSDGQAAEITQTATGQTDSDGVTYTSNKAVLTGLAADTTYYYQVEGKEIESFTTGSTDSFTFALIGDPQIGSSNELKAKSPDDLTDEFYEVQSDSVASDSYNWANTLTQAVEMCTSLGDNLDFIVSAGDQVQTNASKVEDTTISEIEYTGYLLPSVLTSVPVATTVGNHDADNANYQYHFNVPNLSELGDNGYAGGDYYFTYGNALFIMLNTQDTNSAEHVQFIQEAVEANPDCTWRIVTLHQDIYGSAEHSNEPEIVNLRYALTPAFETYDIDLVLTGHDHAYSRSYFLNGDAVEETVSYTDDEFDAMLEVDIDNGDSEEALTVAPGNISDDTEDADEQAYLEYLYEIMDTDRITEDTTYVIDPEGILYLTANSASGSKYYDLTARQQSYIAARWQEDVPTYTLIEVTDTTLTINTYRSDTNETIDECVTIVKTANAE